MSTIMKIKKAILVVALLQVSAFAQEDLSSIFPIKWSCEIGITTYRTNIIEEDGFIYVGSNGNDANSDIDDLDGVHKIDVTSGKIVQSYQGQFIGDNDATGIALKDGKLYFGTDNYYFFCFDVETGQELWKYRTPYDVESVPCVADLDNDGNDEVVFCVQRDGMFCLNTEDGSEQWVLDSISSHDGNVAPLIVDCNGDGILDVIGGYRGSPENSKFAGFKMDHYGDYILALSGDTGLPIWSKSTGAGIHASPFLYSENGEKRIVSMDAYGEMQFLNLKGELVKDMGFGYGMFMSPVMHGTKVCVADFIGELGDQVYEMNERGFNKYIGGDSLDISMKLEGTTSATTVIAGVRGNGQLQYIAVSEEGTLVMGNEDGSDIVQYKFAGGAEATPLIKDIDGDGKLEIMIAALDGKLYCYETNSSGEVYYGQFRWNNTNVPGE